MNPSRFEHLKGVVQAALRLPERQREGYLRDACAADSALFQEAMTLISDETRATDLIKTGGVAGLLDTRTTEDLLRAPSEPLHSRIGPYRIIETLGEGGMGAVYLAEQEEPIRRRVALKLVKLGMDTKEVLARFDTERQALAMMDHPNVARVHDAGSTDMGRPYFVMEYVDGTPITDFCDAGRLSTRERLELFVPVCQAIHHAHQKGIIHRDVKPSNVLVALHEGKPVPKVIDFGIAKATSEGLTEQTAFTAMGQVIGTPEYMSPEQATGAVEGVDTTTDVYSLGVLLYEILTGSLPFETKEFRRAGWETVVKTIREVEPPKPSTRISTIGAGAAEVAAKRRTSVTGLRRQLRGDLDWVVMKAMEKVRSRRYSSAAEFGADVERYLGNLPVAASPPSTIYRMRKFARRYRTALAIAAFIIVSLSYAAFESNRQRAAAVSARDESEVVTTFLSDMLGAVAPDQSGREVSVRQVLDQAEGKIGEKLKGRPLIQARLMNTMGNVYRKLGLADKARPLLEGSLAFREKELGRNHPDVAQSLNDIGGLARMEGDRKRAKELFEQALAIRERTLPPDHPDVARSLNNVGIILQETGESEAALLIYQRILPMQEKALGPDHADVGRTHHNIANLLIGTGDYKAALPHIDLAVRIKEKALGPDHIEVARSLSIKGSALYYLRDYATARRLMERMVSISEKALGPDHPELGQALNGLGAVLLTLEDYEAARTILERALSIIEKGFGPTHGLLDGPLRNLGKLCSETGDYATASKYLARAMSIDEVAFGAASREISAPLLEMGVLNRRMGDHESAKKCLDRALSIREKALGPEHPDVAEVLVHMGELEHEMRDDERARKHMDRALSIREQALGPEHRDVAETLEILASFLRDVGDSAKASALEARANGIREKQPQ